MRGVVEEIFDIESMGEGDKEVFGVIFLFKWRAERDDRPVSHPPGLFFAKQVITNACATQAILSVLLNAPVDLGEEMAAFKSFTSDLPPDVKGESIGSYQALREAHNSFARPEPFEMESKTAKDDDDVFHFIGYVPFENAVYELDGLKSGPIKLADVPPGQSWLVAVRELIKKRINLYVASEIRFNLMQVTRDMREVWAQRTAQLERVVAGAAMDTGADADDPQAELEQLRAKLAAEQEKFASWKEENIRRRHNYVPFIMQMLKTLGERGQLAPLLQQATDRKKEARAAAGKK